MSRLRPFVGVNVAGGELNVRCQNVSDRAVAAFVFFHDAASDSRIWDRTFTRLPTAVAALAPDLRGRAASSELAPAASVEQYLDDLVYLLDHFEIDQAGLIGTGSGSVLAEHLGALLPDRVPLTVGIEESPLDPTAAYSSDSRTDQRAVDFDRMVQHQRQLTGDRSQHYRRLVVGPSFAESADGDHSSGGSVGIDDRAYDGHVIFLRHLGSSSVLLHPQGADSVADLIRSLVRIGG